MKLSDWTRKQGLDFATKRLSKNWDPVTQKRFEDELGTTLSEIQAKYRKDVSRCPQCRKEIGSVGLDFQAPKMGAVLEWRILELLYDNGFAFHGCGCGVGYAPPSKLGELPAFFERHGRKSEGEKLLAKIGAAVA